MFGESIEGEPSEDQRGMFSSIKSEHRTQDSYCAENNTEGDLKMLTPEDLLGMNGDFDWREAQSTSNGGYSQFHKSIADSLFISLNGRPLQSSRSQIFANRNLDDSVDSSSVTLKKEKRRDAPPLPPTVLISSPTSGIPASSYATSTSGICDEISAQRNYGEETNRRKQHWGDFEPFTSVPCNNSSNTVVQDSASISGIRCSPTRELPSQLRVESFEDFDNYIPSPPMVTRDDRRPTFIMNGNHPHVPLSVSTHNSSNHYAPPTYSKLQQGVNIIQRPLFNVIPHEPSVSGSSGNTPSQSQGTFLPFLLSQSNGTDAAQVMNSQMPNHASGFVIRPAVLSGKYVTQKTSIINNLVPIRQTAVHKEVSCSQNPELYSQAVTQNPDYSSNFGMDLTVHGVDLTVPRGASQQSAEAPIQERPSTSGVIKNFQGNETSASSFRPIKCDEDEAINCLDWDASTDSEDKIYSHSPPYAGSQPSVPQNNKKGNLIRDQLLLYLHTSSCRRRSGTDADRECSISQCNSMRKLLTHLETCGEGDSCLYMHCSSTRTIRRHWEKCSEAGCSLCQSMGKQEVLASTKYRVKRENVSSSSLDKAMRIEQIKASLMESAEVIQSNASSSDPRVQAERNFIKQMPLMFDKTKRLEQFERMNELKERLAKSQALHRSQVGNGYYLAASTSSKGRDSPVEIVQLDVTVDVQLPKDRRMVLTSEEMILPKYQLLCYDYFHAKRCKRREEVALKVQECVICKQRQSRKLVEHARQCSSDSCVVNNCFNMRKIISHIEQCKQTDCTFCGLSHRREKNRNTVPVREVFRFDDKSRLMSRLHGTKRDSAGQTILSFGGSNRSSVWHLPEPKESVSSAAEGTSTCVVASLDCQPSTSNADVQSSGTWMMNKETLSAKEKSLKLAELPDGILDNLWKVMECNVCLDIPVPPVFMCSEGHHVCQSCKAKITKCPVCGNPVAESRIRLLESVFESMPLPCPNREYGCRDIFYLAERSNHVLFCRYKP